MFRSLQNKHTNRFGICYQKCKGMDAALASQRMENSVGYGSEKQRNVYST